MRFGSDLRRGGGSLEHVGMEERTRRSVVQLGHRVRLVGRGSEMVMMVGMHRSRVVVVMTRLVRTESAGGARSRTQLLVVMQRIGREQSSAARAPVVQLPVFDVISGWRVVHGAVGGGALGRPRTSADRRPGAAVVVAGARLVVAPGAVDVGRGRREGDECAGAGPGDAGGGGSAVERARVEVGRRRSGRRGGARMSRQEVPGVAIDDVQLRTNRLTVVHTTAYISYGSGQLSLPSLWGRYM